MSDHRMFRKILHLIVSVQLAYVLALPCTAEEPPLPELGERIEFLRDMEKLVTGEIDRRQTPLVFDRNSPPPPQQAAQAEAQINARWMKSAVQQAAKSYQRAAETNDPDIRKVLLKNAALKADTAHQLVKYYLGNDVNMRRPNVEEKRRNEKVATVHVAINAAMKELVTARMAIVAESGKKIDMASSPDLFRKLNEMEAASKRHQQSGNKTSDATFFAEFEYWRRDKDLAYVKMFRLQSEILSSLGAHDVELLPELAQALRSNNPAARKSAETIIQNMVNQGQGPEVLPKIVELLRQLPPEPDSSKQPVLKKLTGFASNILSEIGLHDERLDVVANQADVQSKIEAAKKEWKTGQAGGGGVSLHLPATLQGLDPKSVKAARLVGERFVLTMKDGTQARFPQISLDDLAVALRTIYGPAALLSGRLTAVDGEAIAFETGADQFGEVVWRRSYLPTPVEPGRIGDIIELPIGPAVGISGSPEPSMSRITFYGDIKNTHLGSVISRADQLMSDWFYGIDHASGKFLPLPDVPDFMTMIELEAHLAMEKTELSAKAANSTTTDTNPYAKAWWRGATWFVFVPKNVTYRFNEASGDIKLADSHIKFDIWRSGPNGPIPAHVRFAKLVNQNIDAISAAYPVMEELREVAATVALVRWLKLNDVPVDLQWALDRKVATEQTPDRIPSSVAIISKFNGKPVTKSGVPRK